MARMKKLFPLREKKNIDSRILFVLKITWVDFTIVC